MEQINNKNQYENKSKNDKLDLIYAFLDKHTISLGTFWALVSYKNEKGLKDAGPFNLSRKKGHITKQKIPLRMAFIREISLALNMDLEPLLIDETDEVEFLKTPIGKGKGYRQKDHNYFIRDTWKEIKKRRPAKSVKRVLDLGDFSTGKKITRKALQKSYVEATLSVLDETTTDVSVVEFIGKGTLKAPRKHLGEYHLAHREIFNHIAKLTFQKETLRYTRILTLEFLEKTPEKQLAEAILNLSLDSFVHIFSALQLFDKDKVIISVAPTNRIAHFALVNYAEKPTVIVSEYYKKYLDGVMLEKKEKSVLVPDVTIIHTCQGENDELNILQELYEEEIGRAIDPIREDWFITKDNIKDLTYTAWEQAKNMAGNDKNHPVLEYMNKKIKIMPRIKNRVDKIIENRKWLTLDL